MTNGTTTSRPGCAMRWLSSLQQPQPWSWTAAHTPCWSRAAWERQTKRAQTLDTLRKYWSEWEASQSAMTLNNHTDPYASQDSKLGYLDHTKGNIETIYWCQTCYLICNLVVKIWQCKQSGVRCRMVWPWLIINRCGTKCDTAKLTSSMTELRCKYEKF